MRTSARPLTAVLLGAALITGVEGCDNLPTIDPSRLPEITQGPDASGAPDPEPAPTETVTAEPEPAPIVTETTEAPAPEPEPEVTAAPAEEAVDGEAVDGEPLVWWPWALAAVVLLVLIIVWARVYARRRAWDKRLDSARSELSWFEDSLVPQVLSKPTAAEAAALWQAARPRVLELDQNLHELAEVSPSEARTAEAGRGLQALRGLTAAIDGETSMQAGTDADALRARRATVDTARTDARTWITSTRK